MQMLTQTTAMAPITHSHQASSLASLLAASCSHVCAFLSYLSISLMNQVSSSANFNFYYHHPLHDWCFYYHPYHRHHHPYHRHHHHHHRSHHFYHHYHYSHHHYHNHNHYNNCHHFYCHHHLCHQYHRRL